MISLLPIVRTTAGGAQPPGLTAVREREKEVGEREREGGGGSIPLVA